MLHAWLRSAAYIEATVHVAFVQTEEGRQIIGLTGVIPAATSEDICRTSHFIRDVNDVTRYTFVPIIVKLLLLLLTRRLQCSPWRPCPDPAATRTATRNRHTPILPSLPWLFKALLTRSVFCWIYYRSFRSKQHTRQIPLPSRQTLACIPPHKTNLA